jgi:hypothetical protein
LGEAGTLCSEYVGRRIGGCEIRRRIGAGGMGVVFEAPHLALIEHPSFRKHS